MHDSTTENENMRKHAHDMAFILIRLKTFPPTDSVENGRNDTGTETGKGTETGTEPETGTGTGTETKDIAYKHTFMKFEVASQRIA